MKTLWLGCSHSGGVYNIKDLPQRGLPSLPHRVSEKLGEQQHWKMMSFSAQGILRYNQIIKSLEDYDKLKEFDNVILQLTMEPRLVTWHNNIENNFISDVVIPFIDDDTQTYFNFRNMLDKEFRFMTNTYSLFHLFRDRFDKGEPRKTFLDIADEMVLSTSAFINCSKLIPTIFDTMLERLEKHNLNIYTFYYASNRTNIRVNEKYDILNDNMLFNSKDYVPNVDYVQDTYHPMMPIMDRLTDKLVHALKNNGYR